MSFNTNSVAAGMHTGANHGPHFYDQVKREEREAELFKGPQQTAREEKPDTKEKVSKPGDVSVQNEEKLSQKARDFLKKLRAKYGQYDLMVGNGADEINTLSKSGSKEFSVIFTSDEIEKMAADEKYAAEKLQAVEGAVNMARKIAEENGFASPFGNEGENGRINKIGVAIGDDGKIKIFAELEKTNAKQKVRLEKTRAKHAEERKQADKKQADKNRADKAGKKNPYEKDDKESVKRIVLEAGSAEELAEKIRELNWEAVEEAYSGDRFDFSV